MYIRERNCRCIYQYEACLLQGAIASRRNLLLRGHPGGSGRQQCPKIKIVKRRFEEQEDAEKTLHRLYGRTRRPQAGCSRRMRMWFLKSWALGWPSDIQYSPCLPFWCTCPVPLSLGSSVMSTNAFCVTASVSDTMSIWRSGEYDKNIIARISIIQ